MALQQLTEYLDAKSYPGRTLAIASDPTGSSATIIYFIMGRSTNSQNRIFVQEGESVATQAFDESKVEDPRLIIYPVYKRYGNTHIVTNGDQTATIYQALHSGIAPAEALLQRECEPDAPNFTPRISLTTDPQGYRLNIIKAATKTGEKSLHFDYRFPYLPGLGHCIHTYIDDGNPLPSFCGEPIAFPYTADLGEKVWKAINPDYRISLLECTLNLHTWEMQSIRIFNRHTGD